jgi:hypothetical protein
MRARWLIACLLQAGVWACGTDAPKKAAVTDQTEAGRGGDAAVGNFANPPASAPSETERAEKVARTQSAGRPFDPTVTPAMIIRTGNASIEVDSLEPAMIEVRRLAQRVGGYIANTALQAGREQLRQATLEIKAPADRFDDLTAGLRPLGRVEYINVSAEDVGEEFVDLTARAANGRRLEERLVDILGSRTGRLKDVLEIERELARVREEIERLDGRLRFLRTRAAMSTLSVTVHEPPPLVSPPGGTPIADAFQQAWRNFVGLLAGFIASLGIVVPVAAVAWGAVLLVKWVRK